MKKHILSSLLFVMVLTLSACGGGGGSSNDNNDPTYQAPTYGPPQVDWNQMGNNQRPQGYTGYYSQIPHKCNGRVGAYSYCGNQWYYYWSGYYWSFPSCYTCGTSWYYDYYSYYYDNGNNGGGGGSTNCDKAPANFDSGWKKVWGKMNSNGHKDSASIPISKCGTYYLSFKGDYTGCGQIWEKLKISFDGGNVHRIKDLNDTHTGSGEVTEMCKVPKGFKLQGNTTYKIWLEGTESSVNNTYVRITGEYPNSATRTCE